MIVFKSWTILLAILAILQVVCAAPIGGPPLGTIPFGSALFGSAPASDAPAPVPPAPVGSAPVDDANVGSASVDAVPVGTVPANAAPVGANPLGAFLFGAAPAGTAPVDAPVDDAPINTAPVDSAPVDATVVDTVPVVADNGLREGNYLIGKDGWHIHMEPNAKVVEEYSVVAAPDSPEEPTTWLVERLENGSYSVRDTETGYYLSYTEHAEVDIAIHLNPMMHPFRLVFVSSPLGAAEAYYQILPSMSSGLAVDASADGELSFQRITPENSRKWLFTLKE
ncbi:hypothetical protein BGX29_011750 [Mortierella sp. GBA35]|nr:hypothetical protein BGX29_011750 [Mortierella sp. GBA35]